MTTRKLPNPPRLDHLLEQAETLLEQVHAADPKAVALAARFHPVSTLADAQVVIARSYGFAGWPRLVHHLELVDRYSRSPHEVPSSEDPVDEFLKLATLNYGQDDPTWQVSARELRDEVLATFIPRSWLGKWKLSGLRWLRIRRWPGWKVGRSVGSRLFT
ncbi:MAG: hypothetical protein QOH84_2878 [Kribbellaceae bacterium]|nr:hypothetical protein [Kribbellaceae bacterium]